MELEEVFKVVVCDDELLFGELLKKRIDVKLREKGFLCQTELYSSASALKAVTEQGRSYDIYFLDIDMPGIDGISLGKLIRSREREPYIIFVSSKEGMVFDALAVKPFQFIRKRSMERDFPIVMEALCAELRTERRGRNFVIEVGQVSYRFDVGRTMYIEAEGKYLNIYLTDRMFYVRYQMSALEEILKEYEFLRIHKSYLVNPRYIYLLEPGGARLENGKELPVSRHRFKEVQGKFLEYMHR